MREYLSVLLPLLDGMPVSVDGSTLSAHIGLSTPRAGRVPVLLAAMAPRMLNLAGEQTDGTVLADAGVTDFVAAEFARAEDREKDPQPAEGSHRRKLAPAPLAGRHAAAGPGLNQLSGGQPHLLPAGPLPCGLPAAIGVPHDPGITRPAPGRQRL
jgi:5,10-methylenetetrahydromethanopterin reductase